jgi:hypothetical protein
MKRYFLVLFALLSIVSSSFAERIYIKTMYSNPDTVLNYNKLVIKFQDMNFSKELNSIINSNNYELIPFFKVNSDNLNISNDDYSFSVNSSITELRKYYFIDLSKYSSSEAINIANNFNQFKEISVAYFEPKPVPPPVNTPDFRSNQTYLNPPNEGLGYNSIKNINGSSGKNIKYCDVEYATIAGHEDMDDSKIKVVKPDSTNPLTIYNDHGAAVLGIAFANRNSFGIDGMINDAEIYISYPCYGVQDCNYNVAQAVIDGADALSFGDVILIEQQTSLPYPTNYALGPVEYYDAAFDAIKYAASKGVIVIEAGGNGGVNLDTNFFEGRFDKNLRNSGAIMIGASTNNLDVIGFSPFGKRIDLYAFGQSITTAGYGAIFSDPQKGKTRHYTNGFGGTSGASALVAPAAVSLQGLYYSLTGKKLSPNEMREIFYNTGTPQKSNYRQIGRMPNLNAAYNYIVEIYTSVNDNKTESQPDFQLLNNGNIIKITNWNTGFINNQFDIYDLMGRKVYSFTGMKHDFIDTESLNIDTGVYFIISGKSKFKFVKI